MLLPDQTYEAAPPAHLPTTFYCSNVIHSSSGGGGGVWRARKTAIARRLREQTRDASSSNEAVHLQRRLLSLSSELVTLRNHLHAPAAAAAAAAAPQPAVPPRAPHPPPAPPHPPHPHHLPSNQPTLTSPQPIVGSACTETRWRNSTGTVSQPAPALPVPAPVPCGASPPQCGSAPLPPPGPAAPSAGCDVDDLIHLRGPLTEDAVVRALQARFYQNKFYTSIGPILVALNPYTDTSNALTLTAARAQRPELARLVRDAVRHQADTGYPQAVILSGVSGSGKTHAAMELLRRLFDVAGGGPETDAFKHLAAAFTVLRALGTAHTQHNSNSTRIGNFIEVQVTDGALYRTKIHCYFLEPTRVVRPPPNERNFHIFYQMMAGLSNEERTQLHLDNYSVGDLKYLCAGGGRGGAAASSVDGSRWAAWRACLGVLGIPCLDVARVLAAVLLLGNLTFRTAPDGPEPVGEEVCRIGALLGVGATALVRGLTARGTRRAGGTVTAPTQSVTVAAAVAARDALARALYCRTVATIVRRANSLKRLASTLGTLSSDSTDSVHNQDAASRSAASGSGGGARRGASMAALQDAVRHATDGFVGILDMFGFEDAAPSRLEHLCANLCAETMQHFYNTHVFKSALESCREEGVAPAPHADYADNVPCIDLVSSLRGGLLALLDAECAARRSPEQYVARVRSAHRSHPRLDPPSSACPSPPPRRFTVRHFAGDVVYDATDFLDANRDALADHIVAAFEPNHCDFGFVTHLFGAELKSLAASGGPLGAQFRAWPGPAGGGTLTQDFHTRLDNLLRTLVHARPHFVRCLRANATETPMLFDRTTVAKQVRALQVLETAQLMSSGYPHRMRFRAFQSRYRALWARGGADGAAACGAVLRAVCAAAAPPAPASPAAVRWAVGKRHVFLSEGMRQVLERMRVARREAAAACIQTAWRRHRGRRAPPPAPPAPVTAPPPPAAPRPRPAPIAGTPPPDTNDKDAVKRTCSLFGLDLEVPPPLPPPRAYTVWGGVKLQYPQQRRVARDYSEDGVRLRAGDHVLCTGAAHHGRLNVQVGGRTVAVPHRVLAAPAAPGRLHPPPPPAPPPLTHPPPPPPALA